jgi:hypothetical protein
VQALIFSGYAFLRASVQTVFSSQALWVAFSGLASLASPCLRSSQEQVRVLFPGVRVGFPPRQLFLFSE